MPIVTVAKFSALTPGKGQCVEAGGKKLALFVVDTSPTTQAPIVRGVLMAVVITKQEL